MNIIKKPFESLLKCRATALFILFCTVLHGYAATPTPLHAGQNFETGIDFIIINNSSNELKGIFISLTGNIEGRTITFISADPGTLLAGSSLGAPNNGNNVSAPPNAAVTDVKLTFSTAIGGTVNVQATIDQATPPPINVNVHFWCYCYPDFGSIYTWNYTPGTTIPSSGRRTLTVTIANESDL